jgi:hypothetical protein
MALDLNAAGAKIIDGTGGGSSFSDPLRQTIQISQSNVGAIPVTETALEATVGTTSDAGWLGVGVASLVALLKAIALRLGVGGTAADGGGSIAVGGQAQYLFSSLVPVNGYLVQNNSAANITVSDTAISTGSGINITLAPGIMWVTPPGYKPPGPVSIYGASSGQAFAARKW